MVQFVGKGEVSAVRIDAREAKEKPEHRQLSKLGHPYGEEAFQTLKGKIGGQRVTVTGRGAG